MIIDGGARKSSVKRKSSAKTPKRSVKKQSSKRSTKKRSAKRKTPKRKTPKRKTPKRKTPKRKTPKRKAIKSPKKLSARQRYLGENLGQNAFFNKLRALEKKGDSASMKRRFEMISNIRI